MPARPLFSFEVGGVDPFLKRLNKVTNRRRRRSILRQALLAGSRPVKKALRLEVKSAGLMRRGHLRKSMISVVRQYPSGVGVIIAGVRYRTLPDGENPGNYFHLVDLGVVAHQQTTRPIYIESIAEYRQTRGLGGSIHPGHVGHLVKYAAEQRSWRQVYPAAFRRVAQLVTRELKRG